MKALEQARRALPILFSATMLSLAFPPANVALLVLVALAPWLASLRDTDAVGAKRSGYLFGFLYFLFQMYWLEPFVSKWTGSHLLAIVPWLCAAGVAGFYYMWAGWLVYRCWQVRAVWAVPLVWAGVEAFRSYVIGVSFPWGIAAEPLGRFPMIVQHAAWGTIYLVSATVVLVNLLIANFVWPAKEERLKIGVRQSVSFLSLLAVVVALSIVRFESPQHGRKHVYAVAQTGVDEAFGDPIVRDEKVHRAVDVVTLFATSQRAEVMVLPEGLTHASASVPPEGPVHPVQGLSVIFGGSRIDGKSTFQTAYAYDGSWKYADKSRLVIFGEYVPFRDYLPFLKGFDLPSGDLVPAKQLTTLEVAGVKTGALLCFEGLFPDLSERHCRNGAQVLVQMSIDDWYAHTPAHQQLTDSSVWRSIESGLPLLRSASLGTTLYTDSRGRVLSRAEFGRAASLRAEVEVPSGSDAFPYRFAFVWLCWLAIAWAVADRYFGPFGKKAR